VSRTSSQRPDRKHFSFLQSRGRENRRSRNGCLPCAGVRSHLRVAGELQGTAKKSCANRSALVHNDYYRSVGPQARALIFWPHDEAEAALKKRYVYVNVWLRSAARSRKQPLGICGTRSSLAQKTHDPEDLEVIKDRVGEIHRTRYKHRNHCWDLLPADDARRGYPAEMLTTRARRARPAGPAHTALRPHKPAKCRAPPEHRDPHVSRFYDVLSLELCTNRSSRPFRQARDGKVHEGTKPGRLRSGPAVRQNM